MDIVRVWWGWHVTPGDLGKGDCSGDGFVGGDDLDMVRAHWGCGIRPSLDAIPEPSALALLVGAMLTVVIGRWQYIKK